MTPAPISFVRGDRAEMNADALAIGDPGGRTFWFVSVMPVSTAMKEIRCMTLSIVRLLLKARCWAIPPS